MNEKIFLAVGNIDDKYIEEAYSINKKAQKNYLKHLSRIACILIIAAGIVTFTSRPEDIKKQNESHIKDTVAQKDNEGSSQLTVAEKAEDKPTPQPKLNQSQDKAVSSEIVFEDETAEADANVGGGGVNNYQETMDDFFDKEVSYAYTLCEKIKAAQLSFVKNVKISDEGDRVYVTVTTDDEKELESIYEIDSAGGSIVIIKE